MNFLFIIIFLALILHVALYPVLGTAYRNARTYSTRKRIMWALITSMIADLLFLGVVLDKYYVQ